MRKVEEGRLVPPLSFLRQSPSAFGDWDPNFGEGEVHCLPQEPVKQDIKVRENEIDRANLLKIGKREVGGEGPKHAHCKGAWNWM